MHAGMGKYFFFFFNIVSTFSTVTFARYILYRSDRFTFIIACIFQSITHFLVLSISTLYVDITALSLDLSKNSHAAANRKNQNFESVVLTFDAYSVISDTTPTRSDYEESISRTVVPVRSPSKTQSTRFSQNGTFDRSYSNSR